MIPTKSDGSAPVFLLSTHSTFTAWLNMQLNAVDPSHKDIDPKQLFACLRTGVKLLDMIGYVGGKSVSEGEGEGGGRGRERECNKTEKKD